MSLIENKAEKQIITLNAEISKNEEFLVSEVRARNTNNITYYSNRINTLIGELSVWEQVQESVIKPGDLKDNLNLLLGDLMNQILTYIGGDSYSGRNNDGYRANLDGIRDATRSLKGLIEYT